MKKIIGCPFCTLQGDIGDAPEPIIDAKEHLSCRNIKIMAIGCEGLIDPNKKVLDISVWADGAEHDFISEKVPIKYCPMCGRKL